MRSNPSIPRRQSGARPGLSVGVAALAATLGGAGRAWAQEQTPPGVSYRAPLVALARPDTGSSVPANRPVVVLRVSAGERNDPIDPSTLRVWVDGADRSLLFQMAGGDLWGALGSVTGAPASRDSAAIADQRSGMQNAIAPGTHLLTVQLCSVRGVCGSLHAPVLVIPADNGLPAAPAVAALAPMMLAPLSADSARAHGSRHSVARRFMGAIIGGLRDLLTQLLRRKAQPTTNSLPRQD